MSLHTQLNLPLISRSVCAAACLALFAACASKNHSAPVEDRSSGTRTAPAASAPKPATPVAAPAASSATPAAPVSNAGMGDKPGFYTVKAGDNLYRIALEHGQSYRDVAQWNNLEDVNKINVGQVLRVAPPGSEATAAASTAPVKPATTVQAQPLPQQPASGARPASAVAVATAPATPAATGPENTGIQWGWPATGKLIEGFNDKSNKGMDIAGKMGDPVVAAADGKVVYTGSALRGYGNLVMVKHNETWLTAYAHNRAIMVKEGQDVKRGQKIAEIGNSDSEQPKLHFEVRRQGKPVDPARVLPER